MHRRTLIASTAALAVAAPALAAGKRSGEHDLSGPEAGPGGDPAAAGGRAEDGRAD